LSTDTEVIAAQDVKPQARTYFSHNSTYIIPRVKPVEQVLPNGKTIVTNNSDYERFQVKFENGFLITEPGQLKCPNPDTGEEEDLVTFLESHPRFGKEFFLQEGTAPPATETLMQMATLAAARDQQGLIDLYKQEEANWAREDVLESIMAAVRETERQAEGE
jgi:hypothetical protein